MPEPAPSLTIAASLKSDRPLSPGARLVAAVAALWKGFRFWCEVRRQRRHLGELEDHLLEDVGISRKAARREARRWFVP